MAKMLELNKNFNPCPIITDDEIYRNGIFHFNITKILEYIQQELNNITLEEVSLSDFPENNSSINEAHMSTVKLNHPVILAEISPNNYNLIDGNHRVEKARRSGLKKIMAYRLGVDQHLQFLTDKKAYEIYIEYWNSKLE